MGHVRRVGIGQESLRTDVDGVIRRRWVTRAFVFDVSDDGVQWTPLRSEAARYFVAKEAHALAEHVRREIRGGRAGGVILSGEVVRVLRGKLRE